MQIGSYDQHILAVKQQEALRNLGSDLDPEIVEAIEAWVFVLLRERRGRGTGAQPEGFEDGYALEDFLNVINDAAPDAIARMLQAGASKFLP